MINKQNGSICLCFVLILTCASIYAVSYYVYNSDDFEDGCAPVDEIKNVNFLEPEDKCLFT